MFGWGKQRPFPSAVLAVLVAVLLPSIPVGTGVTHGVTRGKKHGRVLDSGERDPATKAKRKHFVGGLPGSTKPKPAPAGGGPGRTSTHSQEEARRPIEVTGIVHWIKEDNFLEKAHHMVGSFLLRLLVRYAEQCPRRHHSPTVFFCAVISSTVVLWQTVRGSPHR